MCKIKGLHIPDSQATTHYVPLHCACHPSVTGIQDTVKKYDLKNLPKQMHNEMLKDGHEVMEAASGADTK